jgi:hypothetical protein
MKRGVRTVASYFRTLLRWRIARLRRDDLEYYENPLAGQRGKRPLVSGRNWLHFFAVLLGWSFLAKALLAVAASAGLPRPFELSMLAGLAVVLGVDALLERDAGAAAATADLAALDFWALVQVEDVLLMEREFAPRARTDAIGGRIIIGGATVVLFAALYATLPRLPRGLVASPFLIALVVLTLALAVAGGHWFWRLLGLPGRVGLRAVVHYWPFTLSAALYALQLRGLLAPAR